MRPGCGRAAPHQARRCHHADEGRGGHTQQLACVHASRPTSQSSSLATGRGESRRRVRHAGLVARIETAVSRPDLERRTTRLGVSTLVDLSIMRRGADRKNPDKRRSSRPCATGIRYSCSAERGDGPGERRNRNGDEAARCGRRLAVCARCSTTSGPRDRYRARPPIHLVKPRVSRSQGLRAEQGLGRPRLGVRAGHYAASSRSRSNCWRRDDPLAGWVITRSRACYIQEHRCLRRRRAPAPVRAFGANYRAKQREVELPTSCSSCRTASPQVGDRRHALAR